MIQKVDKSARHRHSSILHWVIALRAAGWQYNVFGSVNAAALKDRQNVKFGCGKTLHNVTTVNRGFGCLKHIHHRWVTAPALCVSGPWHFTRSTALTQQYGDHTLGALLEIQFNVPSPKKPILSIQGQSGFRTSLFSTCSVTVIVLFCLSNPGNSALPSVSFP